GIASVTPRNCPWVYRSDRPTLSAIFLGTSGSWATAEVNTKVIDNNANSGIHFILPLLHLQKILHVQPFSYSHSSKRVVNFNSSPVRCLSHKSDRRAP